MSQPIHLAAGDPNPFTPAEMQTLDVPPGTVFTAELANQLLDRMRADAADGQLPEHIQATLDQIAAARVA